VEIFLFVIFIIGVPLGFALIIPRLWLMPCTFLVLLAFAVLRVDEQRMQCGSCGGPFSGIGIAILGIAMVGFIIGIGIRAVIAFFKPAGKVAPGQARAANLLTWALVSATLAVLSTGLAVTLLNRRFDSGWSTHLGICLLAFAWLFLTPFFWPKGGDAESMLSSLLRPAGVFRWVGAVTIFFLMTWSVRSAGTVQDAAELAASGRPYCLTISTEKGQRPARTFWDLSGFSMQADRGSARHAALLAGDVRTPDWFYWSYRRGAFKSDFMGWPVTCEPQLSFAKNLSAMPTVQVVEPATSFWLGRGQWHIPAEYRGGAGDRPPVLLFYAQGRDFGPLPTRTGKPIYDMEMMHSEVRVTLCDLERLHAHQAQNDSNNKVESVGTEAGLEKQSVNSRGWSGREFQYLGRDNTGRISTWLLCREGGDICRHAFRREGMVVEFQHSRSQFAQWRETEDAAWKRVKSFALVWPDAEPQSCKS